MEINYTVSKRFRKAGDTANVALRGSALADEGVTAALIERGWMLNGDRFERRCNAHEINATLWHLVRDFDCKLTWDRPVKKQPKIEQPEPADEIKLVGVPVADMEAGMEISGHGHVLSAERIVGRNLVKRGKTWKHVKDGNGPRGIVFKTSNNPEHGVFYADGSTVACVK